MSLPKNKEELRLRDISTTCPYCGYRVTLNPQSDPLHHSDHAYFMASCPNTSRERCGPIFVVYEGLNRYITRVYPIPNSEANSIHESIPEKIREDYAEAKRCANSCCWKGCVVLCRRVVEAIACDKLGGEARREGDGATKRLGKLIELLFDKRFITTDIKETADEIKFLGDYGAHVQDDELDSVSRDEATAVLKLTAQILQSIYISPYETRKLREKRT